MVSFAVQKLLSLIRSHLFIFVFIFITLGGGSKTILLQFMSESILPMFSSKSIIVSGLTEWEKRFADETTDKSLISKIYKQLMQLSSKKN